MNPPFANLVDPVAMPQAIVEYLFTEGNKAQGRVIQTDDIVEPMPGIRTIRNGGHSMDSQIIVAETTKGIVAFGIENAIIHQHLENHIAPGSPVSLLDPLKAMGMLQSQAEIIVPGHDPGIYHRHPKGLVA